MRTHDCHSIAIFIAQLSFGAFLAGAQPSQAAFQIDREPNAVIIKASGQEILRYNTSQPADSRLTVESACYFHPFTTPAGIPMTQVAPMDHLHHRGIFLGWVEMRGKTDADFWGSGTYAPKKDRKIVNREITAISATNAMASFRARNEWLAEGEPLIIEDVEAAIRAAPPAYVLDLVFTLTPTSDLTLERRAFSGFCVRMPRDGKLEAFGPQGPVDLPNPKPAEPDSNWPTSPWHGYRVQLEDGTTAGIVVVDHPENPPALWHNVRGLRMLNPCIVAAGAVQLKAGEPLVLRYRVIAHDGPNPPESALSRLDNSVLHMQPGIVPSPR
jgi:hypothetical protein